MVLGGFLEAGSIAGAEEMLVLSFLFFPFVPVALDRLLEPTLLVDFLRFEVFVSCFPGAGTEGGFKPPQVGCSIPYSSAWEKGLCKAFSPELGPELPERDIPACGGDTTGRSSSKVNLTRRSVGHIASCITRTSTWTNY